MSLDEMGQRAKLAARSLARLTTEQKNRVLQQIAAGLREQHAAILAANAADVADARTAQLSEALIDRLLLTPERLAAMIADIEQVLNLPDPVGAEFDAAILPNGMPVAKRRVPLGVVGVIYESRPNVTVDVAVLCLKAGSAVILRGGKETMRTNAALVAAMRLALAAAGASEDAVQAITDPDRALVLALLQLDRYVDMIIPRGGAGLHQFCREQATVPVITGGIGVCHVFIDASADLGAAAAVIYNAKVQRPSVCNALDTLLVHQAVAAEVLPQIGAALQTAKVELRADPAALQIFATAGLEAVAASESDWGQEFLALVLSIRVVADLDAALDHIARYSTGHSDAILTTTAAHADRFVQEVDSAAVYVNASTRFTDGAQLGLGAEVAVSTQKLHARGPMALAELTTYKWVAGGIHEQDGAIKHWIRS